MSSTPVRSHVEIAGVTKCGGAWDIPRELWDEDFLPTRRSREEKCLAEVGVEVHEGPVDFDRQLVDSVFCVRSGHAFLQV